MAHYRLAALVLLETLFHIETVEFPKFWTAASMARKINARIRPYSTAVAPEMSLAIRLMRLRIGILYVPSNTA